ncbi:hypothetical protein CEXT_426161, partial [Caerostris extrusa]
MSAFCKSATEAIRKYSDNVREKNLENYRITMILSEVLAELLPKRENRRERKEKEMGKLFFLINF